MYSISDNKDSRICERQQSYIAYIVSRKTETKMFFFVIFYKTRAILLKFGTVFPE